MGISETTACMPLSLVNDDGYLAFCELDFVIIPSGILLHYISGNPFLDICRSQIDMKVQGDCQALLQEMKGFHWMMSYGNYLREIVYALMKLNVELHDVSADKV